MSSCRGLDRAGELVPDPFELAGVDVELGAACAAPSQDLADKNEAACLQKQVVDVVLEDRVVDVRESRHAASASAALAVSPAVSFSGCRTRMAAVRIAAPRASRPSVPKAIRKPWVVAAATDSVAE